MIDWELLTLVAEGLLCAVLILIALVIDNDKRRKRK